MYHYTQQLKDVKPHTKRNILKERRKVDFFTELPFCRGDQLDTMKDTKIRNFILSSGDEISFFFTALPYALGLKKMKDVYQSSVNKDTLQVQKVPLLHVIRDCDIACVYPTNEEDREYISAAKKKLGDSSDNFNSFMKFGPASLINGILSTIFAVSVFTLPIIFLMFMWLDYSRPPLPFEEETSIQYYVHNDLISFGNIAFVVFILACIIFLLRSVSLWGEEYKSVEASALASELFRSKVSIVYDHNMVLGRTANSQYCLSQKIVKDICNDDFSTSAKLLSCKPTFDDVIEKFKERNEEETPSYIPFVSDQRIGVFNTNSNIPDSIQKKVYSTVMDMLQHLVSTTPSFAQDDYGRKKLTTLLTVVALKTFYNEAPFMQKDQEIKKENRKMKEKERKEKKQRSRDEVDSTFDAFFEVF